MPTALCYRQGTIDERVPLDRLDSLLGQTDALLWLDLERPTEKDLALLEEEFGFHPLALEDVQKPQRRAKVDQYDDFSFVVMFDIRLDEEQDQLSFQELKLFAGANYVVTVHDEPIRAISELRVRWRRDPRIVEPHPLGFLLYHIADGLVDDYFPIVDAFEEHIDHLEEELFGGGAIDMLEHIFTVRRRLITMRRLVAQMRDVFNVLSRREQPFFHESTVPYFTDVYDHLLRLTDILEMQRDLLGGALESHLSIQSNQLNQTVRTLTAVTLIVMVPTLIAGIYGMNFQLFPSNDWEQSFWAALGMMALAGLGLLAYFKHLRWL